jgi:hypothetical protein
MVRGVAIAALFVPAVVVAAVGYRGQHADVTMAKRDARSLVPAVPGTPSSAVALAYQNGHQLAFVADADDDAILSFDVGDGEYLGRLEAKGGPAQVLVGRHNRVYGAMRAGGVVRVWEPAGPRGQLREIAQLETSAEPVALAMTNDEVLLVVCAWSHRLEAFSTRSWERTLSVELPREPRAVAVDDAGKRAFVAHAVGSRASVVDLSTGIARSIPLVGSSPSPALHVRHGEGAATLLPALGAARSLGDSMPRETSPPSSPVRFAVQGFSLAKAHVAGEERVLFPGVLVDPGDGRPSAAPRPGYGNAGGLPTEVASVAVVDVESEAAAAASLQAGIVRSKCLLPRAAVADDATGSLFVGCLGSDEVVEYVTVNEVPVHGIRSRWRVAAGPTGVALEPSGNKLVVWSAFDRVLTIIDRDEPDSFVMATATSARLASAFEVGRKLFHAVGDDRIAADGRACASCHPDGRDDGLTWATPDGPRQTPMLAGRLEETAPFGWSGASATVRDHVARTFRSLQGRGLDSAALRALLVYLSRMPTPPAHAPGVLETGSLARGRAIFGSYQAGCSSCHAESAWFSGAESHAIDGASDDRTGVALNTPALRFVSGTAPYFHDGRYGTIRALLQATDGRMGSTSHLSADDFDALVAYVEAL